MRKLLYLVLCVSVLAAMGCAITNYAVITDDRGGYSGVIRTGHKAYVVGTSQVATIYSDGSDELFSMVYQNQYADRKLYTFNNFDPTASVMFMDQTYCDWRYEGCEITRSWDPHQDHLDDIFDYEFFPDCSGARSLSLLVSQGSRLGECGDVWHDQQAMFREFANAGQTKFRGETAYLFSITAADASINLTTNGVSMDMPIFGQFLVMVTDDLNTMIPMTPNMRHEMRWLSNFAAQYGDIVQVVFNYGSLSGTFDVRIAADGLNNNTNRF